MSNETTAADGGMTLREQRVAHIVELMCEFRFERGKTSRELAEQWGLSYQYVRELCAEASRLVRANLGSADEIAAEVAPGLLKAFRAAVERKDSRGAASTARVLCDLAGLGAQKHEVSGPGGTPLSLCPVIQIPPESDD